MLATLINQLESRIWESPQNSFIIRKPWLRKVLYLNMCIICSDIPGFHRPITFVVSCNVQLHYVTKTVLTWLLLAIGIHPYEENLLFYGMISVVVTALVNIVAAKHIFVVKWTAYDGWSGSGSQYNEPASWRKNKPAMFARNITSLIAILLYGNYHKLLWLYI